MEDVNILEAILIMVFLIFNEKYKLTINRKFSKQKRHSNWWF